MTATKLVELIQSRFGESVVVSHLEAKSWFMDPKTKQTWREHLKNTFERRLASAPVGSVAQEVIDESQSFLTQLEHFSPEQTLFSFSASSARWYFAGWAIGDTIVHCYSSEK